jgi:hypothetical protein
MDQPPAKINEKDRRRALRSLQTVWRDLVGQLVDSCVTNEDDLVNAGFSYSYQEIEDRYGQRLFLASQMIGAIQHAGPQRPPPPVRYRVVRVEAPLEELDERITDRLDDLVGHELQDISIASDDDETWHAFLTLSRPE